MDSKESKKITKKRQKHTIRATFIDIDEACNNLWITSKEIRVILGGVSMSKAESFRKELEEKLDKEKVEAELCQNEKERTQKLARSFYYKDTKPHRYPLTRVLEEAHVNLDYVRKQANQMRKSLKIGLEQEREYGIN